MNSFKLAMCCALVNVALGVSAYASTNTIGMGGINSAGLRTFGGMPLDGAGVSIGQVEPTRPPDPGFDEDEDLLNMFVNPAAVFFRHPQEPGIPLPPPDFAPEMDKSMEMSDHATWVASVMISTDGNDPDMDGDSPMGVSPGANLNSAGYNSITVLIDTDIAVAITAQHLATPAGGSVRANNFSFAVPLTARSANGNQHLTLFVDWSAAHHDILYVIAGNQLGETTLCRQMSLMA
jgi:hypothetical protein